MQSDWNVECGADDPVVVLPWQSEDGSLRYVDLRLAPEGIHQISEAQQYTCLAAALPRWNAVDSPVFTAKCDVWSYPAELFDAEDFPDFSFAQGSYIDLISSDLETFGSFAACEKQLRGWTASARSIALQESRCEWTLRAALIFSSSTANPDSSPQAGYAATLYVWGYGGSPSAADAAWCAAIAALTELIAGVKPISEQHASEPETAPKS